MKRDISLNMWCIVSYKPDMSTQNSLYHISICQYMLNKSLHRKLSTLQKESKYIAVARNCYLTFTHQTEADVSYDTH